jgi:hypothetical protein
MKLKTDEGIQATLETIKQVRLETSTMPYSETINKIRYCMDELETCCKEEMKRRSEQKPTRIVLTSNNMVEIPIDKKEDEM